MAGRHTLAGSATHPCLRIDAERTGFDCCCVAILVKLPRSASATGLMTMIAAPSDGWPEPVRSGAQRSILGSDLAVDGDVTSTGPVEVYGHVSGQVRAPELLIAKSGTVDGSSIANELIVQGHIAGVIDARNVVLAAGSVVNADVTHERIAIDSGALFEGQLKRPR